MLVHRARNLIAAIVLAAAGACALFEPSIPEDAIQSHRGIWIGKSNFETVGSVSVHRTGDGDLILIEGTFAVPAIESVVVSLGRNGYVEDATIGDLRRYKGVSVYRVPAGLKVSDFNEVWLWDVNLNRPIGVARLIGV